eukprot:2984516-Lingulodinium_polyedra.AAC.1
MTGGSAATTDMQALLQDRTNKLNTFKTTLKQSPYATNKIQANLQAFNNDFEAQRAVLAKLLVNKKATLGTYKNTLRKTATILKAFDAKAPLFESLVQQTLDG